MLALLLAAMGIYSVLSYVVSIRRQEIGIRLAIGALPSRVLRLVVRQGIVYAAIGTAIGLAVSAVAARVLGSLLHDVAPLDPMTFAIAPMVLIVVATLASLVPGWRATRVDPVSAMRSE
jgi:putative ABC transport system permease protein